jgi:hypothetical protein
MDISEKYIKSASLQRIFNCNGISNVRITSLILLMEKPGCGLDTRQKKRFEGLFFEA